MPDEISLGRATTNIIDGHTTPANIVEDIRNGQWATEIAALRSALRSGDKIEADRIKRNLPAILWSGNFTTRKNNGIERFSGLLCADIDKVAGRVGELHDIARNDPHVVAAFVSPSNTGIKIIFCVPIATDPRQHEQHFNAVRAHVASHYKVEIDKHTGDVARLCFVSHDPTAFFKCGAVPLKLSPSDTMESAHVLPQFYSTGSPEVIVLPSGSVSISESAANIFRQMAPTRSLFWRGGAQVEVVEIDGLQSLEVLKPEKFRSDAEKLGQLFAWRSDGRGNPVLKPAKMSLDDAKAILATDESRRFLPSVASVLRFPVMVESKSGENEILGMGYHEELGGLFIVDAKLPPQVQLNEAIASLERLIEEFDFQTEADRSRALAAFITPALRLGGLIRGNIPIDCAEADKSQAGKGYRHNMVCALYNEASYFITAKTGGVGSVDESFAAALISGRPFICLDNFRGKMDSQNLEAFITCPNSFPARIPHRGEVRIDPRRFILQMSSNGLETTIDLANRACICRIRKRPGFQYRDTLAELQQRQPYYLGCIFAVIAEWIANGKPKTNDTRHDFREWCQVLDWIVQNILRSAPLMDGHQSAQERTSNPALSFLRGVALAVADEQRLNNALIASELVEICELHAIKIPGDPNDEGKAKRQIGSLCKQVFRDGERVELDGFTIIRSDKGYRKPSGDLDTTKAYTFTK